MGNSNASVRQSYQEAIGQLSNVQLSKITQAYKKLHSRGGRKGGLVDRSLFTSYFDVSPVLSERLFEAFDRKKNGLVDFEEFVCGVTLMLHGSFEEKCKLLFDVFNIAGDEGVSYEELTSMLSAIAANTDLILTTFYYPSSSALLEPETSQQVVKRIADAAFEKCDITGNGKLLPLEFQYWLEQNPQILSTLLPQGKLNVTSSTEDMSEVTLTGQAVATERLLRDHQKAEALTVHHQETPEISSHSIIENINISQATEVTEGISCKDQDVTEAVDDQKSTEPLETIYSVSDRNIRLVDDQGVTILTSSEVVSKTNSDQDDSVIVDQQTTGQDIDKLGHNQEAINEAFNQEVVSSQDAPEPITCGVEEAVNNQEAVDLVSVQVISEETDNQEPNMLVNIDQDVVNNSEINQTVTLPPSRDIPQDSASHDIMDTPHHSKSSLEQWDIWQNSFILTQPSCMNCSSELRSLWSEPTLETKLPTQPLQYHTLSVNSDQVLRSVAGVSMDIAGFKELLASGDCLAALELSRRFLAAHGQLHTSTGSSLHTEQTLAMWSGRLLLLYRLGYYRECASELGHFKGFNQSDLFYQSYPNRYGDQRGSMVPFMLRLLEAELPLYCREPDVALDKLFLLKESCEKLLSLLGTSQPEASALWRNRLAHVMLAIGNCLLSIQEYSLAIDVYKQLNVMLPERLQPTIISAIGRIHLLLGDVGAAKECFAVVASSQPDQEHLQNQLNRVAVMVFQSAYAEAYEMTQKMLLQHSDNMLVLNNAAVCAFYTGRQQEALQLLQQAAKIRTSEAISINMKAIYDLEASGSQADNKRRSIAQTPRVS